MNCSLNYCIALRYVGGGSRRALDNGSEGSNRQRGKSEKLHDLSCSYNIELDIPVC